MESTLDSKHHTTTPVVNTPRAASDAPPTSLPIESASNESTATPSVWKGLAPLFFFVSLFLFAGVAYDNFYVLPACVALLPALALGIVLSERPLNDAVEDAISGMADKDAISMVVIYLLAGAFNGLMAHDDVGGVVSVVGLMQRMTLGTSSALLVPGVFAASTLVAFAIGTSMGTIAAVVPIAVKMAEGLPVGVKAVMVGAVLSGAACGDNLSPISDTAIAACNSQRANRDDKMKANARLAFPAFALAFLSMLLLSPDTSSSGGAILQSRFDEMSAFVGASPYLFLIVLVLVFKLHVVVVLLTSMVWAVLIGLGQCASASVFLQSLPSVVDKGMAGEMDIVLTALFMAGLTRLMSPAMKPIAHHLTSFVTSICPARFAGEVAIALVVVLADCACANNTVAIIMVGEIAYSIATAHQVEPVRAAVVLDVASCVNQALLPYGAQLLLAGRLSGLSPVALMGHSHYPIWLGVVTIFLFVRSNRADVANGADVLAPHSD